MNTKCDKEQFIEKSKALFGSDAFDYSSVEYINGYTDITLVCRKHGKFTITPNKHLDIVGGCPECSKERRRKRKMMSNDEYKQLVINMHGDKYDLSKVEYRGMREKVTATCPIHGDFSIVAYDFANKRGCGKCGAEKRAKDGASKRGGLTGRTKMTTESFIAKSKEVFGERYDYSKTDVNDKDEKGRVLIICPKHGEFRQNPYSHLHGHGCSKCGSEKGGETQSITTEKFIEKARKVHGGKYDYSQTVYTGCYDKVDIICPKHGKFSQVAYSHLEGHGCRKCANEFMTGINLSNTEEFIKKAKEIHGDENDYSLVDYKGAKEPVMIKCKKGHIYYQMPNKHLSGHACPYCTSNVSRQEKEITDFVESLGFTTKKSDRKVLDGAKEIDITVPDKSIAIEFDGLYWHDEIRKPDKNYHLSKTEECGRKGLRLIHIFEDEWLDKKDIVKSRLKDILGTAKNKIYARKCEIRTVDSEECGKFLDENHIQGNIKAPIRYGLYHDGELVSVMTFCRPRRNLGSTGKDGEYELLRFCSRLDTVVTGGASKLFAHFVKEHAPNDVVSYADRRWNTGNVYKKMGFEFSHFSQPNYFYIIGQHRFNRFNFRKDILVKQGFDKDKSEHEIMLERGIYRIYDCGCAVYKWIKKD